MLQRFCIRDYGTMLEHSPDPPPMGCSVTPGGQTPGCGVLPLPVVQLRADAGADCLEGLISLLALDPTDVSRLEIRVKRAASPICHQQNRVQSGVCRPLAAPAAHFMFRLHLRAAAAAVAAVPAVPAVPAAAPGSSAYADFPPVSCSPPRSTWLQGTTGSG